MKNTLFSLLIGAVLMLFFSGAAHAKHPQPGAWKQFVSVLEMKNPEALRQHIRFPLESNLAVIPGWASIRTEVGFLAKYDELLPPEAIDFFKKSRLEDVFRSENQTGTADQPKWRLVWTDNSGDPDEETSLLYTLVITEAGEIRIVAIDGAG